MKKRFYITKCIKIEQWFPVGLTLWRKCVSKAPYPRQREEWADERQPPDNIFAVPKMLMLLVLAQTFCLLAPLVLPAAALVFGVANVVYKYLFLQVFEQRGAGSELYDSGGLLWLSVVKCVTVGLLCSHFTLMAVLVLKEGWFQMLCLLPLPVLAWFAQSSYGRLFEQAAKYLPLMECINLEHSFIGAQARDKSFLEKAYRQSCLDPDKVAAELQIDQRVVTSTAYVAKDAKHKTTRSSPARVKREGKRESGAEAPQSGFTLREQAILAHVDAAMAQDELKARIKAASPAKHGGDDVNAAPRRSSSSAAARETAGPPMPVIPGAEDEEADEDEVGSGDVPPALPPVQPEPEPETETPHRP